MTDWLAQNGKHSARAIAAISGRHVACSASDVRKLWMLSLFLSMSPVRAAADCAKPPLALLWTYPEEGAREVPVNAELWVLVPWGWARVKARLDNAEIPFTGDSAADGMIHLVPGALAPEHDYLLRLEFENYLGSTRGEPQLRELHFRTGTTRAAPLASARVSGHEAVPESLQAPAMRDVPCADILQAQGCIDVGPNTLHTFDASAPGAIGWLIGGFVLPARCGVTVRHSYWARGTVCFELRPVGPGGLIGAATNACATDLKADGRHPDLADLSAEQAQTDPSDAPEEEMQPPPELRNDENGCSVASSPRSLPWLSLVAFTLLRRRRGSR